MESQKVKGGYHHFILRARVESGKHTRIDSYIFRKEGSGAFYPNDSFSEVPQDIVDKVSECIMEHTSIPFIKEWGRYVCRHAMSRNDFEDVHLDGINETEADYGVKSIVRFSMSAWEVERDIRNGLANHTISIDGCKSSSDTFKDTEGLSAYLDNFGTALATQTTKTFHPAFDPSKEEISKKVNDFYDLCEFYVPEIVPYKKQKHVIEAGSRCLKDKNSFLISGDPGAGKTIMAIGTVATSAWRPDYSVDCMVPPGLVTRWEDAITKTVPMSDVRIITDMKGFLAAAKELKNPLRMRSLWVIMSNNVVKADFAMHPSVIWSEDRNCYVCPHCGRPVVVEMDEELAHAYQGIIENVVTVVNNGGRVRTTTSRAVKNAIGVADMFLDQPYGLYTTRVDGEVIELSPEPIRPKEQKLIEICKDKKEKNEKMLIYVQWTGKLDIVNRLSKLLKDEGIRAIGFSSKVKINERRKWLEEQAKDGVDAVILNPELVGTGFNLLDYTTIIFYEIGNKLPIVRQAKDRSKRINQEHPVSVYFLYYKDTVQEDTLALISQKLKAAKAMEGDFTESALQDMGGDTDILTKLVSSIVKNEHIHVDEDNFEKTEVKSDEVNSVAEKRKKRSVIHFRPTSFLLAEPEEPQYISMCA